MMSIAVGSMNLLLMAPLQLPRKRRNLSDRGMDLHRNPVYSRLNFFAKPPGGCSRDNGRSLTTGS